MKNSVHRGREAAVIRTFHCHGRGVGKSGRLQRVAPGVQGVIPGIQSVGPGFRHPAPRKS